jgi:CRISPR/Cas system CSM-associated protein Csm4 (group 5 of RAMP superfamily)
MNQSESICLNVVKKIKLNKITLLSDKEDKQENLRKKRHAGARCKNSNNGKISIFSTNLFSDSWFLQ